LDLAVVMRMHGHRGKSSMPVQLGEGEGNRRGGRRHVFSGLRFFSTKGERRESGRLWKMVQGGGGVKKRRARSRSCWREAMVRYGG
jgi:hypothetical protein